MRHLVQHTIVVSRNTPLPNTLKLLLALLLLRILAPSNAIAAWSKDGVPLGLPAGTQFWSCTASVGNDAVAAWVDYRTTPPGDLNILAQRITSRGDLRWNPSGVRVCGAAGEQTAPQVVDDGAGGAFIAWIDSRALPGIYAQHLDSNGTALWEPDGRLIGVGQAGGGKRSYEIISDGDHGLILLWLRLVGGTAGEVTAQHISGTGLPLWSAPGIRASGVLTLNTDLRLTRTPTGEFLVGWSGVPCCAAGVQPEIGLQKLTPSGGVLWSSTGILVTRGLFSQPDFEVVSDLVGGCFVCYNPNAIAIKHIDSSGSTAEPEITIYGGPGNAHGLSAAADGAGGVVIGWADSRVFADNANNDIYVQRLRVDGTQEWTAGGVRLSGFADDSPPFLLSDNAGGAFLLWGTDYPTPRILAQRIDASGAPRWTAGGVLVASERSLESVSPAPGQIFASFSGARFGHLTTLATAVDTAGVPAFLRSLMPAIAGLTDVPRDEGGWCSLSLTPGAADTPGFNPAITGYSVWMRAPATSVSGSGQDVWSAGSPVWSVGHGENVQIPASASAAAGFPPGAWRSIGFYPAVQGAQSLLIPTIVDSSEAGNGWQVYVVSAHTSDPALFVVTPPDSGYSVDNLAPGAPVPFTARFSPSGTALHWTPSRARDFAYFELYRGTGPGFVPSPSTLLLNSPDTGYVDPTVGERYYKLAAVDRHGNRSAFAAVGPEFPVAALASVVDVINTPGRVAITWSVVTGSHTGLALSRRTSTGPWEERGTLEADGLGRVRYIDTDVVPGETYTYRLGLQDAGQLVFAGELELVAEAWAFSMGAVEPNPLTGVHASVALVLREQLAPTTLDLLDVGGRVIDRLDLSQLTAGRHTVQLPALSRAPAGVYFLRLTQGQHSASRRVAVLK